MAAEKPESVGFLAVIERRIAALKALADSYRAAVSLGALGPGDVDRSALGVIPVNGTPDGPIDLPQGALLGKSLPAAVKLWLTAVRKKQTVREITTALREGGVESTSPNFENVVTGALHRLKANNEVLRFKDGWALAEFYSASLRSSLNKDAGPQKVAKRGKKVKRPKMARTEKSEAIIAEPTHPADDNKMMAMLGLLTVNPSAGKTLSEVLDAVRQQGMECSRDYARVALKRLGQRGRLEKRGDRYFATGVASKAHQAA